MSKHSFNSQYLNAAYPDDILQNIILGDLIYDGKNRVKTADGFTQLIHNKDVNIKYRVNSKESFFKDRKNHIIIKIKDVQ